MSESHKEKLDQEIIKFLDEQYKQFERNYGEIEVANHFSRILEIIKTRFSNDQYFKQIKDSEQSWKTRMGHMLEYLFKRNISSQIGKGLCCSSFTKAELKESYDQISKQITVSFSNNRKMLPDIDLVIYRKEPSIKVVAILSIKKKFRERIAQVAYWTIKLRQLGGKVKNFMVTTDEDNTFKEKRRTRETEEEIAKAIAIAEEDINGTFVAAERETLSSEKIKPYKELFDELRKLS